MQTLKSKQVRKLRHGKQRVTPLFIVIAQRNASDATRFCFVASKKIGNAPQRNRARRLLREAARRADIPPGYDIVFIARGKILTARMQDVLREMNKLGK